MPRALVDLVSRNRRRYGGYVVHLSIVILVVVVTASSAYSTVRESHLRIGQSMVVDGYTLKNTGVFQRPGPNYTFEYVRLAVSRGGSPHGILEPGQRIYDTGQIVGSAATPDTSSAPLVRMPFSESSCTSSTKRLWSPNTTAP